jgi:hypothetical protein
MSIDFVIRDKIQNLLNQLTSGGKANDINYQEQFKEFQLFVEDHYPKLCNYIEEMEDTNVSQGKHYDLLERIKSENPDFRNNLKLTLKLLMAVTSAELNDSGFESYKEQEDWFNELNKLDSL